MEAAKMQDIARMDLNVIFMEACIFWGEHGIVD
jgi:hypothetical protein